MGTYIDRRLFRMRNGGHIDTQDQTMFLANGFIIVVCIGPTFQKCYT